MCPVCGISGMCVDHSHYPSLGAPTVSKPSQSLVDMAHKALYRRYYHLCTLSALYKMLGPYAPEYLAFVGSESSPVLPLGMTYHVIYA